MNNYIVHTVLITKVLIGGKSIDCLFQHDSKLLSSLN